MSHYFIVALYRTPDIPTAAPYPFSSICFHQASLQCFVLSEIHLQKLSFCRIYCAWALWMYRVQKPWLISCDWSFYSARVFKRVQVEKENKSSSRVCEKKSVAILAVILFSMWKLEWRSSCSADLFFFFFSIATRRERELSRQCESKTEWKP